MAEPARPTRAYVRDLFLRLMGLVFLSAFLSLLVQVTALVGDDGLLPARDMLARAGGILDAPTARLAFLTLAILSSHHDAEHYSC